MSFEHEPFELAVVSKKPHLRRRRVNQSAHLKAVMLRSPRSSSENSQGTLSLTYLLLSERHEQANNCLLKQHQSTITIISIVHLKAALTSHSAIKNEAIKDEKRQKAIKSRR